MKIYIYIIPKSRFKLRVIYQTRMFTLFFPERIFTKIPPFIDKKEYFAKFISKELRKL